MVTGLYLSLDYYEINISDAIIFTNSTVIFEACVDSPTLDNPFCDLLSRAQGTGLADFVEMTKHGFMVAYET